MIPFPSNTPTFQRLLAVTEELIREKGCRKTTLQDIINRSGLSKGAIYHYVKSKDELFGLLLVQKMEAINRAFHEAVGRASVGDLENPLWAITRGIVKQFTDPNDVSNRIFLYLVGQRDDPRIAALLKTLYEFSLKMTVKWIEIGQTYRAIPPEVDARKMAERFIVFTYGLRLKSSIVPEEKAIDPEELFRMFLHNLRPEQA
ncbi:MAG TPA: TetR/AcrR family transcriptional regulator [Calditerricola sp.]